MQERDARKRKRKGKGKRGNEQLSEFGEVRETWKRSCEAVVEEDAFWREKNEEGKSQKEGEGESIRIERGGTTNSASSFVRSATESGIVPSSMLSYKNLCV